MREPPGPLWGRAASCCLWPRWCSARRRARPLCVPVGGGPPARRPRCELRSARRLEARPGPTAAHGHRSQALRSLRRPPHQWSRVCCWLAWRVGSKPGQAPPPPRGTAARPRSCGLPMALHDKQRARLKPPSPLLVRACVGLKPPSPLRVRNGRFWCIFRLQWYCRFQWSLFGGEQWCRRFHAGLHQWLQRCYWFQRRHVVAPRARKSSPCSA